MDHDHRVGSNSALTANRQVKVQAALHVRVQISGAVHEVVERYEPVGIRQRQVDHEVGKHRGSGHLQIEEAEIYAEVQVRRGNLRGQLGFIELEESIGIGERIRRR